MTDRFSLGRNAPSPCTPLAYRNRAPPAYTSRRRKLGEHEQRRHCRGGGSERGRHPPAVLEDRVRGRRVRLGPPRQREGHPQPEVCAWVVLCFSAALAAVAS